MNIIDAVKLVKKAIEQIDMQATKKNCDSATVAYFWLDIIAESCNNVDKQKGGEPIDGESEKQNA